MARKAVKLVADIETINTLKKWKNSTKVENRLNFRAKIILCCLQGKTNLEVSQELEINRFTVSKWEKRFNKEGLKGLYDIQRPGKNMYLILKINYSKF